MTFKVELKLKDVNKTLIFDDVYVIHTYIECLTFCRELSGDYEYNYTWDRIESIKIENI